MVNNITKDTSANLCTNLTLIFVVLKLTNLIAWSWWWVLAPLWVVFVFAIIIYTILFTVLGFTKWRWF